MELSCEKVSARLQPATAGHARLVLSKTVSFFCSGLYNVDYRNPFFNLYAKCSVNLSRARPGAARPNSGAFSGPWLILQS